MMKRASGLMRVSALMMIGAAASLSVKAAEVAVPSGALLPGTSVVVWMDADGFNKEAMTKAMNAVIAVAPAAERERMQTEMAANLEQMAPIFEASAQLKADGVTSGVVTMVAPENPGEQPLTQVFLHSKPGTDPKAAVTKTAKAMNAWAAANNPDAAQDAAELEAKLESATFVKINETWHALQVDDGSIAALPAAGEAMNPAPFVDALKNEDGASVRFAFLMSDQVKQQMQAAAASPEMMMMAGIIQPLADMKVATGGMWLGDQPKVRFSMVFGQEGSAAAFKGATDGMIQFMSQMMMMQAAQGGGEAPDMQKMQAVMPLMLLDQKGAVISKTIDTAMLTKLTEAGIPWASN